MPLKSWRELYEDAVFYAEVMGPMETGDVDYRPAARRCIEAIKRTDILAL